MSVNINAASYDELLSLHDIGKTRANAILQERSRKGILTKTDATAIFEIPPSVWQELLESGKINFDPITPHTESEKEVQDFIKGLQEDLRSKAANLEEFNNEFSQQKTTWNQQLQTIEEKHKADLDLMKLEFEEQIYRMQNKFQRETEAERAATEEREAYWVRREKEIMIKMEMEKKISQIAPESIYSREASNRLVGKYSVVEKAEHKPEMKRNHEENNTKISIGGPMTPKMSTFEGKRDWRAYHTQFMHIANICKWTEKQKLDNLIVCLRDRALKFYSSRSKAVKENFSDLCQKLNDRFSRTDLPHIIRRQLQEAKQGYEESIEEFTDRIQELVIDGYPASPDQFTQIVAIDAFLRGCTEKKAALVAMDKNPTSLEQALQYMKSAATNQRLILGIRKTGEVKWVTYADTVTDTDEQQEPVVRAIFKEKAEKPLEVRIRKTEDDITEIKKSVGQIISLLKNRDLGSRSRSPMRSPVRRTPANSECFSCGEIGHFAASCPKRSPNRDRSPSPRITFESPLKGKGLRM